MSTAEAAQQCAWCGRYTTSEALPVGERQQLRQELSHGICAECSAQELARLRRSPIFLGWITSRP